MTSCGAIHLLLIGLLLGAPCTAVYAEAAVTLEQWQRQLRRMIEQPRFAGGQWGIKVVSLDTSRTLFEEQPHKLFQPASNTKLFTAAIVLDCLGPDYRIRTSIVAGSPPDEQGAVHGDVFVMGRGDPSMRSQPDTDGSEAPLSRLASVFTEHGVHRIQGKLVGDESYLEGTARARGWMWEDLERGYGPRLSALSIDGNTFELSVAPAALAGEPCRVDLHQPNDRLAIVNRTLTTDEAAERAVSAARLLGTDRVVVTGEIQRGSDVELLFVPMDDPAGWFMTQLAVELQQRGTRLESGVSVRSASSSDPDLDYELGSVESPPLLEMLQEMLKHSDNLSAALLFAHAEVGVNGSPATTSSPSASCLVNGFLEKHGFPTTEVVIEEGSGLSHNNLVSPHAVVALLRYLDDCPAARPLIEGLPLAGVEGTLQERFVGTPAQANLRAKTGTLHWAQALSGYVTSQAGERLAFSILLNRYRPPESASALSAVEELDAVALQITRLAVHSEHGK